MKRDSISGSGYGSSSKEEMGWDLVDRCLLPLVFSHALAVILSTLLNTFNVSQVSTFPLFIGFTVVSLSATLFYHNLKVSSAGKCVLITDCESKIGSTAAKHLDELGMTVLACFAELGETSDKLKTACSGRLHCLKMDVTSEPSVQQAYNTVLRILANNDTSLWGLINTHCWSAFGEVEWVPMSVYQKSTEVNLLGTVRTVQTFLPLIRKTKGRIVNVLSIAGRIASDMKSAFCCGKAGAEAFTECLRLEMRRHGVDVVVIEPGHHSTGTWFDNKKMLEEAREMWSNMSQEARQDFGEQYFEQRIRSMKEYNRPHEMDVTVVIKCIGDAIVRTFPLNRYTPLTKQEKIEAIVAHHLPRSVYDILYS